MTTAKSTTNSEDAVHHPLSDLNELTVLGIEHVQGEGTPTLTPEDPNKALPQTTLMVIAGTEVMHQQQLHQNGDEEACNGPNNDSHNHAESAGGAAAAGTTTGGHHHHHVLKRTPSLMSSITELDFATFDTDNIVVRNWDLKQKYSDLILEGVRYQREHQQRQHCNNSTESSANHHTSHKPMMISENIVMLFESPGTSSTNTAFTNTKTYRFHDWPPLKSTRTKGIIGPGRYASMNGDALPVFLREDPPPGLLDHWQKYIPGFVRPTFCSQILPDQTVYAYLPVESLDKHVNDPSVHYHLAGKDAIHLMTQKTTRLLADTKTVRPCVVKTTHSMGSKGIFIITDDADEAEFEEYHKASGNPTFVVTDFVDIHRNVACHFFIHPDGSIVWFGSNENHRLPDGKFSSDSYLIMKDQAKLKRMQMPFVEEVVTYCQSLNFWGFCGIDVLFDSMGKGYLVDINPRVTGSCPALMTLSLLHRQYNYTVGLFRRSGNTTYHGTVQELLAKVDAHNTKKTTTDNSDCSRCPHRPDDDDNDDDDDNNNHTTENETNGTTTQSSVPSSQIILHSFLEVQPGITRVNIGVYGNDLEECKRLLNEYARPADWTSTH